MSVTTEPINAELEALLLGNFHEPNTLAVYADWLEGCGDPRALLIHLSLEAERASGTTELSLTPMTPRLQKLIDRNWARWFGSILPRELELRWAHGFPFEARFCAAPEKMETDSTVLSCPSLRFVHRLTVGRRVGPPTMAAVDQLRSLRHLGWSTSAKGTLAPLGGMVLPKLETFSLEVFSQQSDEDLAGLCSAAFPSLREFELNGWREGLFGAFAAALRAPWFKGVRVFTVHVHDPSVAQAVLEAPAALQPLGAGLVLVMPDALLGSYARLLQKFLPRATLKGLPPQSSPDDFYVPPEATDAPVLAPKDFRTSPPRTLVKQADPRDTVYVGSGFETVRDRFSLCASCSSTDTRQIYSFHSRVDDERGEVSTFTDSEYECRACGRFTHWKRIHYT